MTAMPSLLRRVLVIAVVLLTVLTTAPPALAQRDDDGDGAPARNCDRPGADGAQPEDGSDDGDSSRRRGRRGRDRVRQSQPCPPPPKQVPIAGLGSAPAAPTDLDLQAALDNVGFLEAWFAGTPTHPRLSLIAVHGAGAERTRAALLGQVDELVTVRETTTTLLNVTHQAVARRRAVERDIELVDARIETLEAELTRVRARLAQLRDDLAEVVAALRDAAVGLYMSDTTSGIGGVDDIDNYNAHEELVVQVDVTIEELLGQQQALETEIADHERQARDLEAEIDGALTTRAELVRQVASIGETIDTLTGEITALTQRRVEIELALPTTIDEHHQARLLAQPPSVDFPLVVLDAYVSAAETTAAVDPGCGLRWELLAGIARVESGHATFGGASPRADGTVDRKILGPLLDGTVPDTAVITDTDGGALDGNSSYDAAVGPFQFIPGTWRGFALDATGDGFADPHNLYDAGLSAAGYLCAASNVGTDAGVRRSVLAYNHSLQYLADVTGGARNYIVSLGLPAPAFDPETVEVAEGWTLSLDRPDPFEALGQIGPKSQPVGLAFEPVAGD